MEEVETDIEIIENAYNANPDDEELKNICQQVLDKLDDMAGISSIMESMGGEEAFLDAMKKL